MFSVLRPPGLHAQGDVTSNIFSQNRAVKDGSIVFRTECIGQVSATSNQGLNTASTQVHTDNNSGSGGSSGGSSSSSSSSTGGGSSSEYSDYSA